MHFKAHIIIALLFFVFAPIQAQEEEPLNHHAPAQSGVHDPKWHQGRFELLGGIAVGVNPTHIGDKSDVYFFPKVHVMMQYNVNSWFNTGFIYELELASYLVENHEGDSIARHYANVFILDYNFRLVDYLSIGSGIGYEFEREENFMLIPINIEYIRPFGHRFIFGPEINIDFKLLPHRESFQSFYNFSVGVNFGYVF